MNAKSKKVALITGAGSGMGQLAARRMLDSGWAVAALDVNATGMDALGDTRDLLKLVVDITDPVAVDAAVDEAELRLGPIEYVLNAAAIMPLGLLTEQPREVIHKIMAINYGGLVNITKAALPRMLERGRGEFVSFASMVGVWPIIYMGAYSATKFAVVAFTEVLYHENRGKGVRFACVCPPAVATPLLKQAHDTVYPKMLEAAKPVRPEAVLDAVDRALERGDFMVFTDLTCRILWRVRRWMPNLLWRKVHSVEGF